MAKSINKMSRKYAAKIFGKYELDAKGNIVRDKFGDRVGKAFYRFSSRVSHASHKPWVGKYSDMLEMKAFRLHQLNVRKMKGGSGERV